MMKYFKCGHVMTTHGIKGDLKIRSLSDFNRFYKGSRLYLYHNGQYEEVKVAKASVFKNDYLVSFEGLEDINLVQKYHGDDIYISEFDRQDELGENEYYYNDLIGKSVVNQQGEDRGTVIEVRELPQADYLVISYLDKSVLVPFIKEFVTEVNEKITVKEIEGLF